MLSTLWKQILTTLAIFEFAWLIYGVIYRLLLSPLAKIPGPKLGALSSWYEFYYDVIQPGRYVFKIKELHKEYGPIVRVSPWELHINDVDYLDEIYAPASRRRDKYDFQVRPFRLPLSVGATTNHDIHRKRREALVPFFSKKSITALEPIILQRVEKLKGRLEEHLKQQMPINLSELYYAFAMDVVKKYCFGHDDNLLENPERASALRINLSRLLLGSKANAHFPWIGDVLNELPTAWTKFIMPPGLVDLNEFGRRIRGDIEQVMDDKDNAKLDDTRSVFYELRDSPTLPPAEKSSRRLEQEGILLIMAGTDSPAKSLVITHYHLLAQPSILSRLRSELATVPPSASWSELEQLPYLSAVIAEGNRLSFGVTARLCRIAPDETLHYRDYAIPPGTPVSMTTLCAHTDENVFPDPWTFNPDRWLGPKGAELRKYQLAFSKGGTTCIGLSLAHAELFLAVAAVARYDMTLFETDAGDVEFQHDYHVGYPRLDSKGVRAMVKGKAAIA